VRIRPDEGMTSKLFLIENVGLVSGFITAHAHGSLYCATASCLGGDALPVVFPFKTAAEETIVRNKLQEFALQPSAIIRSPGQLDSFWFLKFPMSVAAEEARERAERLQRCLAEALGGEPTVEWVPLPGTTGVELEIGDEPPRYRAEEFEDFFAVRNEYDYEQPSTPAQGTPIGDYEVHPAAAVFPILEGEEFDSLVTDIRTNGLIHPIVLAPNGTVIDGRNRLLACLKAGCELKFITLGPEHDEKSLIDYVVSANLERRHLDTEQRVLIGLKLKPLYAALAKERQRTSGPGIYGGKPLLPKLAEADGKPAPTSREQVARKVGVSPGSMQKAEKIEKEAPDLLPKLREMGLDEAYREANARAKAHDPAPKKKPSNNTVILKTHEGQEVEYPLPKGRSTFNPTNDFISWAAWSWNPVTGCLHGCPYCYARELATKASYAATYPVGFTPLFHHERLDAPANTPVPAEVAEDPRRGRVFVCSMADLYGAWVKEEEIELVHQACRNNPQWEYLMLTKFPARYTSLKNLPPTAWLGASVDEQKRVHLAEDAFRRIKGVRVKWLSLEPLREELKFSDLSMFDWIVIGSQSETRQPTGIFPSFAAPFEWVARIVAQAREAGCAVYLKPNLLGITDGQNPGMVLPQEVPKLK
jgi:protein gp37/ParB-like chromosome segregation protein Spo0J